VRGRTQERLRAVEGEVGSLLRCATAGFFALSGLLLQFSAARTKNRWFWLAGCFVLACRLLSMQETVQGPAGRRVRLGAGTAGGTWLESGDHFDAIMVNFKSVTSLRSSAAGALGAVRSPTGVDASAAGGAPGLVAVGPGDVPAEEVRSIFISDLHLGSRFSRCEELLDFLLGYQPENLFLVGDFIDGWALERHWYWPAAYSLLLERLVEMSAAGTNVYYTPGNHDDFLRRRQDSPPPLTIRDEFVHTCADGRRMVIIHGDQFDEVESNMRWLSKLGSASYEVMLLGDRVTHRMLGWVGATPKPMSHAVKRIVKKTIQRISGFESRLVKHTREKACDGIICGHIHRPSNQMLGDVQYVNLGDWMENATALVEYLDGRLELLDLRRPKDVDDDELPETQSVRRDPEVVAAAANLVDDLLGDFNGDFNGHGEAAGS
jgi:UDP-2,3-diacylglucosamine pyrophosphatase LpxH